LQTGGEPRAVAAPSQKVALPESLDDWEDDFDLGLSITKNKQKPDNSSVTKAAVTDAAVAAAPTTKPVVARKKSLFDDDDDDDFL